MFVLSTTRFWIFLFRPDYVTLLLRLSIGHRLLFLAPFAVLLFVVLVLVLIVSALDMVNTCIVSVRASLNSNVQASF